MLPRVYPSSKGRRRASGLVAVRRPTPSDRVKAKGEPHVILVVDDNEDNRDLYASYLSYAGYEVEQATNGEEALAIVHARPLDLVVMDLAMPKLDGWETTRIIKSNPRTSGIRVLVLTGQVTEDDERRARAAGADEFCAKPLLPHEMLEVVQELLETPPSEP